MTIMAFNLASLATVTITFPQGPFTARIFCYLENQEHLITRQQVQTRYSASEKDLFPQLPALKSTFMSNFALIMSSICRHPSPGGWV